MGKIFIGKNNMDNFDRILYSVATVLVTITLVTLIILIIIALSNSCCC